MADSGPGIAGPLSGDPAAASADGRMGMLALNDLVYKLNPDLSVAVNRTHKVMYPQTQQYDNKQVTVFLVNSGADYVDPSTSNFFFTIELDEVKMQQPVGRTAAANNSLNHPQFDWQSPQFNCYFGPNGSILNLIDSVFVSSRSGEELSRLNNYAQLMNIYMPATFGQDWRATIGSNMAIGSYIGADGWVPNEQRRRTFQVPLYLLSPLFNYGRLLPATLVSGLRIEIRWKSLDVATQQFWTGAPKYLPGTNEAAVNPRFNDPQTDYAMFLCPNDLLPANPKFPLCLDTDQAGNPCPISLETKWHYSSGPWSGYDLDKNMGRLNATNPGPVGIDFRTFTYTAAMVGADSPLLGQHIFAKGSIIALPLQSTKISDNYLEAKTEEEGLALRALLRKLPGYPAALPLTFKFLVLDIAGDGTLIVQPMTGSDAFSGLECDGTLGPENGARMGPMLFANYGPAVYQSKPGEYFHSGIMRLPSQPITSFTIRNPFLSLACTTLTDAIQRALNEFSAVNGLEIVYSDFSHTTTPFVTFGENNPVYLEIRQSASRALMAFARVIETSPNPHLYDSFSSCPYSWWNSYQLQLGSLYFPQQRVEDGHADPEIRRDNVAVQAFSYFLDAWSRLHPKAAPTMLSLRGDENTENSSAVNYHPVGSVGQHSTDAYLKPVSKFGKWGSYVHGAYTVAATLERSNTFDNSGIPTNNSRVLALRGDVGFNIPAEKQATFRAAIVAYLKYVRLARVFLLNLEVEE